MQKLGAEARRRKASALKHLAAVVVVVDRAEARKVASAIAGALQQIPDREQEG